MKWFKHFSNAHNDNALNKVRMRYGAEGYAIYWYCLELIAGDLEGENANFELSHDAEVIGFNLKIDQLKVEEIMRYMVDLKLFEQSDSTITCLKMAKFLDKKTTRNKEIHKIIDSFNDISNVADKSAFVADKSKQSRLEEKRREETYTPDFVNQDLWADFLSMRNSLKAKNTPRAIKLLVTELEKLVLQGNDANAVIENSIRNSWKDVYQLKTKVSIDQTKAKSWKDKIEYEY